MTDRRFSVKKKASQNRPHITLLVLLAILVVGAIWLFWPPQDKVKQGLDVKGGLSVVLSAEKPDGSTVTNEEMQDASNIVSQRVNLLGASEATVQIQGDNQLLVQIPGLIDSTQALDTIGATGRLEFIDVSKVTDGTMQTIINSNLGYDRNYLVGLGAILPGDIPPNAQLFTSGFGSSGVLSFPNITSNFSASYSEDMTKNILTEDALPAQSFNGTKWTPVKLSANMYADATIFSGESITRVSVDRASQASADYSVNLGLSSDAAQKFSTTTTALAPTNGKIAILIDGYLQSAPSVNEPITGGEVSITGGYTIDQANQLKSILQSGSLPVTLNIETSQTVGPTLGQDALKSGVIVAIIGLSIVAIYLLLFYKGIGLLTAAAIGVFAILYLGVLALLSALGQFALSLAGIAGIVLAIGVAADSSILVLERFKEEIRMGRSVKAASMTGVRHAIITSIDADLVTLISALALFFFATGSVGGFGLTLAIGVVCDIIVMLIFKAPIIRLLAPKVITKHPKFWGIKEDEDIAFSRGEVNRGVENG